MSGPTVDLIDSTVLPRPRHDAWYAPGLVSDYYQINQGYHILRRGGSDKAYLVYSLEGLGFVRDRHDRVVYLEPGDFALIEARSYQEYGIAPGCALWRCHWVHFDVPSDWAEWVPLAHADLVEGVSFARVESSAVRERISGVLFDVHTQANRPEAWRVPLRLNLIEWVLILAKDGQRGVRLRPRDPRVSRVLKLIEDRAPAPPTDAELRAASGLSPSRLASVFRSQVGISVMGAVNRVRLRAAKYALLDPTRKMEDIAAQTGFQSPYAFSNWFLKQTGQRPGSFRRDQWAQRAAQRDDSRQA